MALYSAGQGGWEGLMSKTCVHEHACMGPPMTFRATLCIAPYIAWGFATCASLHGQPATGPYRIAVWKGLSLLAQRSDWVITKASTSTARSKRILVFHHLESRMERMFHVQINIELKSISVKLTRHWLQWYILPGSDPYRIVALERLFATCTQKRLGHSRSSDLHSSF